MNNTQDNFIAEKMKEFDRIFYEGDDALFDRSGNNVSRPVEEFICLALQDQQERMLRQIEDYFKGLIYVQSPRLTKENLMKSILGDTNTTE